MYVVNILICDTWKAMDYRFNSTWAAILKMAEWAKLFNSKVACITSAETGEILYEL